MRWFIDLEGWKWRSCVWVECLFDGSYCIFRKFLIIVGVGDLGIIG